MNQDNEVTRSIITAASTSYGPSLLALLGSLNLNWPGHPPVTIYDLGLDAATLDILGEHQCKVVKVPPFCDHWRKHFTWKLWCLNDAGTKDILWIDAGIVALRPLDETFSLIERIGYFLVPNYQLLDWEASEANCRGCGVDFAFRKDKLTLAGGLMGFRKEGIIHEILKEALGISLTEEYIRATENTHRHDQAIVSLLFYKHLKHVVMSDGVVYLGWLSPHQTPGQKAWVHRRKILQHDLDHFASRISGPGIPHIPKDPNLLVLSGNLANRIYMILRYIIIRRSWFHIRHTTKIVFTKQQPITKPYDGVRD